MAEVKAKVQKATLYKMISYKGIEGKQNSYTPLTAAARLPKTEKSIQRGMTGVMMGECRRRGVAAMSILAEADGEIGQGVIPDARAAARIIS